MDDNGRSKTCTSLRCQLWTTLKYRTNFSRYRRNTAKRTDASLVRLLFVESLIARESRNKNHSALLKVSHAIINLEFGS
jgi:hypothetical protein